MITLKKLLYKVQIMCHLVEYTIHLKKLQSLDDNYELNSTHKTSKHKNTVHNLEIFQRLQNKRKM